MHPGRRRSSTSTSAHPVDPDVRRRAQSIRKLRGVMLDVADIDELMFQLRHVQDVIRELPEGVHMSRACPDILGTLFDRVAKPRQRRVLLALQNGAN
jgi:hypothetical protein